MNFRATKLAIFLLCSLATLTKSTAAQGVTFDGCTDINGIPVASVSNTRIQDIAMATIYNGRPVIFYNPNVVASVRSQTRLFFYAHECGHHALGHALSGLRLGQEQEADCWGIQKLKELNLVSEIDLSMIQNDLATYGRGDWTHLPGPQRAINLRACLDDDSSAPSRRGHWEQTECTHPMHPRGDIGPCEHACYGPYGPIPCHPNGDLYPCVHPAHPNGHRVWVPDSE
jgi:hypothetical protein